MSKMSSTSEATLNWAKQRGLPIHFANETGSTNDDAKHAALTETEELILYFADHQTAGRGRGENTWLDTGAGEGFLSTWSLAMQVQPPAVTGPRIGLALFLAASATWPSMSWSLKAPNDLFLQGKKVAGLLVEAVSDGERVRLLVGLGMNVMNHPRLLVEATHLSEVMGQSLDEAEWFQFLDELKAQLEGARVDLAQAKLSPSVCEELKHALNANTARPFVVMQVTEDGDLIHAQGTLPWRKL